MAERLSEYAHDMERKIEERTRQLFQMEVKLISASKMSALGEMAGGVAHEINNPLAIIKTASSMLQEMCVEANFDKTRLRALTLKIEKTTDRIAQIVQGLRTFSRDGSADPFVNVNVAQLIADTLVFCLERLKHSGTELIQLCDVTLSIEGRATEISQVLLNLLNNALDAVSKLDEKWIRLEVEDANGSVKIRVIDSGRGIPPEIRSKMFQPFYTTKEIGKGTGLGLSISLGIVQTHGGDLTIDDQCANTSVVLRLPKRQLGGV